MMAFRDFLLGMPFPMDEDEMREAWNAAIEAAALACDTYPKRRPDWSGYGAAEELAETIRGLKAVKDH